MTAQALATAQASALSAQAHSTRLQNAVTPAIVAQDAASTEPRRRWPSPTLELQWPTRRDTLATDQVLQAAAVAQGQQSLNDAEAKTTQDASNLQATVAQAPSQLDADDAALRGSAYLASPRLSVTLEQPSSKTPRRCRPATEAQQSSVLSADQTLRAGEQQPDQRPERRRGQAQLRSGSHRQRRPSGSDCKRLVPSTLASNAVKEQPPTADDLAGAQAGVLSAQDAVALPSGTKATPPPRLPTAGTIMATSATVGGSASGSSSSPPATASSSSSTSSASISTVSPSMTFRPCK